MPGSPGIRQSANPDHAERGHRALGPHRAKLRFERLPAAYCHPERIGAFMPDGLPTTFRDRLHASTRLRLRLSHLIARRFKLEACTIDDLATPEGRFVQLEGDDLHHAVRRIGAIWHARKIRKIILATPLRDLVERLGRDTHRAALRLINLSADDDNRTGDEPPDIDTLMGWIERDGLIALNAWCRRQPASLGERLRLKLAPCSESDEEPPASHRERGQMIVDRVVTMLMTEPTTTADRHD